MGIAACQIAKALGAVVIATAGSAEKLSVAQREGGADFGVNYTENGWEKQVKKLTGGKGVEYAQLLTTRSVCHHLNRMTLVLSMILLGWSTNL